MSNYQFYNFFARGASEEYVLNKEKSIDAYKGYMINRLMKMFKYENLPETIPYYMLEYYLMVNGSCVIAEKDGELYAFMGSFGGEPDPYYRPTQYVVANPALRFDKTFPLWDTRGFKNDECVFMRNDVMWMGLNPLMSRYATLLAENTITMRSADVMLRIVAMLTAPDDKTRLAAEAYLKDLEKGKLGVIAENRFFDGVKMQSPPSNNGSYLTQFIELHQYFLGSFYNEIGLTASFNMKRESIGEGEASMNEEVLAPLVETMLTCRMEDVSRLNELFNLDVKVQFDSSWLMNFLENEFRKSVIVQKESQVSQLTDLDNMEEGDKDIAEEVIEDIAGELGEVGGEEILEEELEDVSQLTEEEEQEQSEEKEEEGDEESDREEKRDDED